MCFLSLIATIIICCTSSCTLVKSSNSALSMPQTALPALSGMGSPFFGQPPSASNPISMSDSSTSSQTPQFIPLPSMSISSISSKSSVNSRQLSALLNQSSFPLLGSSVAPHMSITPQVEKIPQSFLLSMDLLAIETIYGKFTKTMAPLLSKTSNHIKYKVKKLEKLSQFKRFQQIPSLLKLYAPIYEHFANGTNLITNANLVSKKPIGSGPFIYLTAVQWKTILSGLRLFAGSNIDIVNLLHRLEKENKYLISTMKKGANDTIILNLSKINDQYELGIALALSNKNIQRSFKMIESIHQQGITKYQTNENSFNFLESYFSWLLDVAGVFRLISPNIKAFSHVFQNGGTTNSTAGTFSVNYLGVDALVEHTNTKLAELIRILGDYFELFNITINGLLKTLSTTKT